MKIAEYFRIRKLKKHRERRYKIFPPGGQYKTKDYLDEVLSERLKRLFGMEYDGDYSWRSSWEGDRRKVVELTLTQGDNAYFTWGYEFKSFPEIRHGRLRYYNTHIQLHEVPKAIIDASDSCYIFDVPMHAENILEIKKEILAVWENTFSEIDAWFQRLSTFEEILDELDYRKKRQGLYSMFRPEPDHIKAYIFTKQGKKLEAIELIKTTMDYNTLPEADKDKLKKSLMSK